MRYLPESHRVQNILALQGPDIAGEISDRLRDLMHYVWRVRKPTVRDYLHTGDKVNRLQVCRLRMMARAGRLNGGQAIVWRRLLERGAK